MSMARQSGPRISDEQVVAESTALWALWLLVCCAGSLALVGLACAVRWLAGILL